MRVITSEVSQVEEILIMNIKTKTITKRLFFL